MSNTDLIIETKWLMDLSPALYNNPRAITLDALVGLCHGVERFRLVEPVMWSRQTGLVVGGHQDGGMAIREMNGIPVGTGESRGEKARSRLISQKSVGKVNITTNYWSLSGPPDLGALS